MPNTRPLVLGFYVARKHPSTCKVDERFLIDYSRAAELDRATGTSTDTTETEQGELAMRRKLRMELAEILELPMDIKLDLPRVVIVGDLGVLISNHRGLISTRERIVVGVGAGQITVSGDNLEIEEVGQEQVVVKGLIKFVEMNTA